MQFIFNFYFNFLFRYNYYGVIQKVCHSGGGVGGFTEKVTKVTQGKGVQGRSKGTSSLSFEDFSASTVWRQFCFSETIYLSQVEGNGCYGRASLFLVIEANRENDDLLEA